MIARLRNHVVAMRCAMLALAPLVTSAALAQTEVRLDVTSGAKRIPIRTDALKASGDRSAAQTSAQADEVLANDLEHSAVFAVTRGWSGATAPADLQAAVGGTWTARGSEIRLAGEVRDTPAGRLIFQREYRGQVGQWRALVHRFADDVVLQFTGERGVSGTRIAYVVESNRTKELYVMDADGANAHALTADKSIALSPAWSPEGSLLLFTSYRSGVGPQIMVMPSTGGKIYLVSGRPGLNTSASYSPDGRDIVCTLSMDGNSEIYLLDARGEHPRRLTNSRAIDTAPAWSPTGREIAFTSDRSGNPHVYVMDREGGNAHRLTYDVDFTDSPAWSPRGDRIAFVSRTSNGFDIYVSRADGSNAQLVVSGGSNENPRWSPDGRHLVFASNRDGPRALYVTDLDGRPPRRLTPSGVVASSPAWSPRPAESSMTTTGSAAPSTGGNP